MADDNGNGGDGGDGGTDDTGGQGGTELTPEQLRTELAKVRREAAASRTKVNELTPLAKRAKELEDAGKSAEERLTGERDQHKAAASAAELRAMRAEVALDKGLTRSQAKRLVGSTIEELEADADELIKDLGGKSDTETTRRPPGQAPRERLRSGGGGEREEPEETDPRKLAEKIRRRS